MNAYIDNNILVQIEKENISIDSIKSKIDKSIIDIYYSAAHIAEAEEITADNEIVRIDRINKRIDTIEKITNCNYLYHSLKENIVLKIKEKPSNVLNTIRGVPYVSQTVKTIVNLVGEDHRKQIREHFNLNSNILNNYKPHELISHLNNKMEGSISFLEYIETGISLNPNGRKFGLAHRIAVIFEFLDMLGYWTDKYNDKSNYARMWDSNHTFHGSYCDYFITDDKRTRMKAMVVYHIYNISTIVIGSNGEA